MKQLAIDICIYCCDKATNTRIINDIEIGICDKHSDISNEEIIETIGNINKI